MLAHRCLSVLSSGLLAAGVLASCTSAPTAPEATPAESRATAPSSTLVPAPTTLPPTLPPTRVVAAAEPGRVAAASRPAELGRRITAAEDLVRDPATRTAAVRASAFELQQLYRQLGRKPRWEDAVVRRVPARLRLAVRANLAARLEFRAMHTTLSTTLPRWRIVEPAPADRLLSFYRAAQKRFGVPWEILAAVNLVETGMGRIRGTSTAGAQGPMQFMPSTWAAFGRGDVNDPRDAIMAAARYLAHNGGGDGRITNALYRYNNSGHYVRGVEHYAAVMRDDPAAFRGYYHWQVVFASAQGDVWLPTGYAEKRSIPARRYLLAHPGHRLTD